MFGVSKKQREQHRDTILNEARTAARDAITDILEGKRAARVSGRGFYKNVEFLDEVLTDHVFNKVAKRIDDRFNIAVEQEVDRQIQQRLHGEKFIDEIVARINRKQVKGK